MKKYFPFISGLTIVIILAACLFYIFNPDHVELQQGMIAWYPFNNSLNDSSGFGQHAQASDDTMRFEPDRFGNAHGAVFFDGKSDLLTARVSPRVTSSGSLSVSCYFKTLSTHTQNLICRRRKYECQLPEDFGGLTWSVNAVTQREPHFAVVSPEDIQCDEPIGINAYTDIVYGMKKLETNTWYHILCVFENGIQRIYINGVLSQSLSRSFSRLRECSESMYVIGAYVNELPILFHGAIDDLRIYDRLLTDEEIAYLAEGLYKDRN